MEIVQQNSKNLNQTRLDLLAVPINQGKLNLGSALPKELSAQINQHLALGDLAKKAGSNLVFYPAQAKPSKRVLLVETGKSPLLSALRPVYANLKSFLSKYPTCGIILPQGNNSFVAEIIIQTAYAGLYKQHEHKTQVEEEEKNQLQKLVLFSNKNLKNTIHQADAVGEAINLLKNLSNQPANLLTPKLFAKAAEKVAQANALDFKSLDEKAMAKLGMGGILGVSKGSEEEARLIILEYNPKAKKTVGLAGKGITFDSGGISLKPSKDMHEMKHDMTGGASVLAVMQIASRLKLPWHVVGVVAAAENLPSGKATKPGDIVKTFSGKTVEVLNTDAEGRMVLCDALSYLQKTYRPDLIVDFATLTGAVVVALGNKITGAFGNTQKFNSQLLRAAQTAGEDIHFLPLYPGYEEELKSKMADLANIGKQRVDSIIAALFLKQFIEKNTPWIHLDIAGTAWNEDGATGATLPAMTEFLSKLKI